MVNNKICTKSKIIIEFNEFRIYKGRKDNLHSQCKLCHNLNPKI